MGKLKPAAEHLVLKKEEAKEKTASGIYIPPTSQEKSNVAVVEAVGSDVKAYKVGDRIIYKGYDLSEVKLDGEKYIVIKEEFIVALIED